MTIMTTLVGTYWHTNNVNNKEKKKERAIRCNPSSRSGGGEGEAQKMIRRKSKRHPNDNKLST